LVLTVIDIKFSLFVYNDEDFLLQLANGGTHLSTNARVVLLPPLADST